MTYTMYAYHPTPNLIPPLTPSPSPVFFLSFICLSKAVMEDELAKEAEMAPVPVVSDPAELPPRPASQPMYIQN